MHRTLLFAAFLAAFAFSGAARASEFTYHGNLQDAGKPAEGKYDIELTLYSAVTGGSVIAGPLILYAVPVHDGSFSTEADFGPLTKSSSQAYVGVKVRSAGKGEYAALDSRSSVTPDTNSSCPGSWSLDGNAGNPVGSYLGTADNKPLDFKVNGVRVGELSDPDATRSPNINFGYSQNLVGNSIQGATIGGGGNSDTSCGPAFNELCNNSATDSFATVAGGWDNHATGTRSAISGGYANRASGDASAIAGGRLNFASGTDSFVAGGYRNFAGGDESFAAGANAHVRDPTEGGDPIAGDAGTFIWSDGSATNTPFKSTGRAQFLVKANGGVGINAAPTNPDIELTITSNATGPDYPNILLRPRAANGNGILITAGDGNGTNNAGFYIDEYNGSAQSRRMQLANDGSAYLRSNTSGANTGVTLPPNGGAWSSLSDRNVKTAIAAIDPVAILQRLARMPVSEWSYTAQGAGIRHMGPMAQDFAAAFSIGEDNTHISTIDADGVAFAAIKGLNQKLESENASLQRKLDDVLARLGKLEAEKGK